MALLLSLLLFSGCGEEHNATTETTTQTPSIQSSSLPDTTSGSESANSSESESDVGATLPEQSAASSDTASSSTAANNTSTSQTDTSHTSATVPATPKKATTNPFAVRYKGVIPANATKVNYDERRFGIITGLIYASDGTTPLEGVRVSIKDHGEYGSVLSDASGRYQIATEASGIQVLDFYKKGYTPIQRRVTTRFNQISAAAKISMLEIDAKSTRINLSGSAIQSHTSTRIDDERGARAATIVFDNVRKATVVNKNGSTYHLDVLNVRATEFTTPQSMPATLPPTSAFTYCIDVTVDGVDKDAMVYFDNNVSFFVDNFLGVPVGTIVPVGYYDRTQALWVAMPNGIVVRLLDGDGDGVVDGVDADDDGEADDINRNGSVSDEAAGLSDKARFIAGESFTMFYSDHFTSIDANYGPGGNTTPPPFPDDSDFSGKPQITPIICLNSYIDPTDQSFHEDVAIPGTPYTLWYNTKNYTPEGTYPL